MLRFKGHYLSVATLGLIVIIRSLLQNNPDYTNGAKGLTGIAGLSDTFTIYAVMIAAMFILHRILHSAYGRSMIAIRDDIVAAESLGVGLARHRLLAFCVSAFLAAVAGGLWAHVQKVISPSFFYYDRTFDIVETSIIGGMYSLSGSVVGALIMTFVPEYLSTLEAGITLFGHPLYGAAQLILSALMIVIIIFRRQGIVGYSDVIVDSWFDGAVYRSAFSAGEYRRAGPRDQGPVFRKSPGGGLTRIRIGYFDATAFTRHTSSRAIPQEEALSDEGACKGPPSIDGGCGFMLDSGGGRGVLDGGRGAAQAAEADHHAGRQDRGKGRDASADRHAFAGRVRPVRHVVQQQ